MGFLSKTNKMNVPDELPALITEEIKARSKEKEMQDIKEEIKQEIKSPEIKELKPEENKNQIVNIQKEPEILISENNIVPERKVIPEQNNEKQVKINQQVENTSKISEEVKEKNYSKLFNDSFFIKLQENLSHEMNSLDRLEDWYNNQLLPKDNLLEMKNYWEKQTSHSIIQLLGKDFQDKITEKIILLQELEKKWQDIYFELIGEEEKIKEEEKELKKMLAEFIGFCKNRMKNEKRNEKKKVQNSKKKSC